MERRRSKIQTGTKTEDKVKLDRKTPQQGTGIRCVACGGQTRVIRSLPKPEDSVHGRYRQCDVCGVRMYTEEKIIFKFDSK